MVRGLGNGAAYGGTATFFRRGCTEQNLVNDFLKKIMLAGGLLLRACFGADPLSIDDVQAKPAN